jgi:transposase-like protein
MKRRRWKAEQKALIVLEGLKGRPVGELCAEHEISQAQYDQWRDQFLANAVRPLLRGGQQGDSRLEGAVELDRAVLAASGPEPRLDRLQRVL